MGFESCHPAVNFLFFTAVFYAGITFTHPVFMGIAYLCAWTYSVKRNGRKTTVSNLLLLPLAIVFALYYASTHHFGVTVWKQNFIGNNMTLESIVYGLVIGVRGCIVCMWSECLFSVVSSDKVVYLFGKVSPRLSLFLTILLRLIPRVKTEARRIDLAQKGIGKGSDQGNLFVRARNCLRIFSMLITWIIQTIALESDSMKSRGTMLRGRTAFSVYRFDNRDRAFVIALFSGIILGTMGIVMGATKMYYNPRIVWKPMTAIDCMTAAGYAFACLLPMGLECRMDHCFRKARCAAFSVTPDRS